MDAAENLIDTKFSCLICGEVFSVSACIFTDQEQLQPTLACWMVEHIDRHGGNPEKVAFSVPFEGTMLRVSQ